MAENKTKSEAVREAVVDWMGGSDRFFRVRDVTSAMDHGAIKTGDKSSTVSAALATWAEHGMIVKGYTLEQQQEGPRSTRRFRLVPALPSGVPDPPETTSLSKMAKALKNAGIHPQHKDYTRRMFVGKDITGTVMEAKADGSMLVQFGEDLYVMRKLDW